MLLFPEFPARFHVTLLIILVVPAVMNSLWIRSKQKRNSKKCGSSCNPDAFFAGIPRKTGI